MAEFSWEITKKKKKASQNQKEISCYSAKNFANHSRENIFWRMITRWWISRWRLWYMLLTSMLLTFGTKSCTSCYLDMKWTEEKDRDTLRKYMSSTLQWFKLFKLSKVCFAFAFLYFCIFEYHTCGWQTRDNVKFRMRNLSYHGRKTCFRLTF